MTTDKGRLFSLGFENPNENSSLSERILLRNTYLSCLVFYTVYVIQYSVFSRLISTIYLRIML